MKAHVSVITLGVEDLDRAKRFYAALGWPLHQDYPQWVSFAVNDGGMAIGLIAREALAADAGTSSAGNGFAGITLNYLVRSEERVDGVLAEAERAGARIVKPAEDTPWGGRSGYFADPDGYRWKVASNAEEPLAAE